MAIDAHPEALDNDLLVANGETAVTGMALEQVDDAIEELIAIGSDPIASGENPAIRRNRTYMPWEPLQASIIGSTWEESTPEESGTQLCPASQWLHQLHGPQIVCSR